MTTRKYNINNLDDLQAIKRGLKFQYTMQQESLISDAKTYVSSFSIGNLIKKYATPSSFFKVDEKYNVSKAVLSMVLPFVMNSTIFRGSGFLTKTLVGLASNRVGKSLDAEHISGLFNSVKSLFGNKNKHKKSAAYVDYGIPPDSETY